MNLSANLVVAASLAYAALLFMVAYWGDRKARAGKAGWLHSPLVYTLSISVYCTSWTFYGAVGSAARNGLEYVTIYLGPTLVFVGWWWLLRKLVHIGRAHRITSIADLISSRYGKSTLLGVVATLIAGVATTPYIALQLKAVTASYQVIAGTARGPTDFRAGLLVACGMAVFTIIFGVRNIDANERHHGVVAAIAFEAIVKLAALVAVGLFVVFGLFEGPRALFASDGAAMLHAPDAFGARWVALTFLSATAIICLPRQFQVCVVENTNERHLAMASWLFPAYLLLLSLFVLPIAIAGMDILATSGGSISSVESDMFVLTLPMWAGQDWLALFAFLGGFSSATSMIVISCIALSTMVSNQVVVPLWLGTEGAHERETGDMRRLLLMSRRISIVFILGFGFLYFRLSAAPDALASMGLIAFVGVAQFIPAIIGGLYWPHANGRGALLGLIMGFCLWFYTLFIPSLGADVMMSAEMIAHGPWGIEAFKPQALLGWKGDDTLIHALFWSLIANTICFVFGSLSRDLRPIERLQGTLFIDVFKTRAEGQHLVLQRDATSEDLYILAQRVLSQEEAHRLFRQAARAQGRSDASPEPTDAFIDQLERRLSAGVGAASARAMISQITQKERVSLDELMTIADETARLVSYSQELEKKSVELEDAAARLRQANDRLKELDAQKDNFFSQISHELRTPMTAIRSFSEILLDTNDLDANERRRFLSIINDESQRLTRLLDDILDMKQLEQGDVNVSMQVINPEAALDKALDTCQALALGAGARIKSGVRACRIDVMADEDRLTQVFINLLSNAVRHNSHPQPRIAVSSHGNGGMYRVIVADNGEGVRLDARERIFSHYSTTWRHPDGAAPGAGLGLAISRDIMRRMGGDLVLLNHDADEDQAIGGLSGAHFCVYLPRAVRKAQVLTRDAQSSRVSAK